MASRKCSECDVKWPDTAEFSECPICGKRTSWLSMYDESPEWKERLALAQAAAPIPAEAKVDTNRLTRFLDAGLDIERAMEFAGDRTVDLHAFEKLLKDGCPVSTAAKIVAPVG